MGHEYIELKNPEAAIEAYRHAVDVNALDYRASYGLGQVYQILKMTRFALYYYQQAAAIRPYDPRMHCAVAQCYETLGRSPEAIRCYERAVASGDREGIALARLAALHDSLQQASKAAYYYKVNLERLIEQGGQSQDRVDALLYLARHCVQINRLRDAEAYCYALLDYTGPEKELGKALLSEIHSKIKM